MIRAVADTHAVVWYLFDIPRLSARASSIFSEAEERGDQIAVSSISFVEIIYLVEKKRIYAATFERLANEMQRSKAVLVEVFVDLQISRAMAAVSRDAIPDMPDRIIAATALHLGVPLISRDRRIQLSDVETIW
jgi:PIN domain nuclease of toxin-antitoxin system